MKERLLKWVQQIAMTLDGSPHFTALKNGIQATNSSYDHRRPAVHYHQLPGAGRVGHRSSGKHPEGHQQPFFRDRTLRIHPADHVFGNHCPLGGNRNFLLSVQKLSDQ